MIKKYVVGPDVISRKVAFSTENLDVFHLHLEDGVMECYLAGWGSGPSAKHTTCTGLVSAYLKKEVTPQSAAYTVMRCTIETARRPRFDRPEEILAVVAELLCGIQEFVGPLSFDGEAGLNSLGKSYDELGEYVRNTPYLGTGNEDLNR